MAKGDDALRRKRNKINRKRLRNSESAVSARVASIIAAKCRRKAGKRRICEGMCFSLPTTDDPFNERHEKKATKKNKKSKKRKLNRRDNGRRDSDSALDTDKKLQERVGCVTDTEAMLMKKPVENTEFNGEAGGFENGSVSKFLMLCLKVVEDTWVEEGTLNKGMAGALLSSSWGAEFYKVCLAGSSVVENSGASATRDQVAWLASTAADIVARMEKQGIIVPSPSLLFIVSSQDRAIEVRAVCKPLKALGIHTVSIHSGISLDHQVQGLKNCQPEFLVSTPERLLELVSLKAVDISGTSLLVVDGLRKFVDLGLLDNLKSIRESISGCPQIIIFNDNLGDMSVTVLLQHLIRGSVYWLSAHESVASTSTFISQYVHAYTSEEEKLSEKEMLGREPTMTELYQRTHQRQKSSQWVDQRSKHVHTEYVRMREQLIQSSQGVGSSTQPSKFETWQQVVGGKKKGRIYRLGSVAHATSSSSQSMDSSGSTLEVIIKRHVESIHKQYQEDIRVIHDQNKQYQEIMRVMQDQIRRLQRFVGKDNEIVTDEGEGEGEDEEEQAHSDDESTE